MGQRPRSDRIPFAAKLLMTAVMSAGGLVLGCGAAVQSPSAIASATPFEGTTPRPASPSPRPSASPSPSPSPVPLIYEDLSGVATTAELAHRYPIAVMIDDSPAARQQSGLSVASIVWQAPAEGNIPRYMAIFQSGTPVRIGPVRSARLYFVRWAAEWKAVYLHAGGPPPLRSFLAGRQQLVIDVNGRITSRVRFRAAPHNLYSAGARLRRFAEEDLPTSKLAYDPSEPGRLQPFRDAAPESGRGRDGGTIRVGYTSARVGYVYERASNTWLRSVDGRDQHDALDTANRGHGAIGTGARIAPTTVVVMVVPIRRSASIEGSALGRLEADSIGKNTAWVFADGRVTKGTWSKKTPTDRTRFFDARGQEIAFPRGQIFVQVVPKASAATFTVEATR
jgi:hypothetical protein